MEALGKKKQKKLTEGAGFFLSLLRETDSTFDQILPPDEKLNDAEMDVSSTVLKTTDLAEEHHQASPYSEHKPKKADFPFVCHITEDAAATLEKLLDDVREQCSPIINPEHSIASSSSQYADYRFNGKEIPEQILCYKTPFSTSPRNFIKGCKWSPDGVHLVVGSDDRRLRVFGLPNQFYERKFENFQKVGLNHVNVFNAGELVYDFCWYPYVCHPNENCTLFAYTSCDHPIHLRDVNKADVVASYLPKNHLDERTNAICLCFSLDGRHLYAGFKDCIRVFDFLRPGPQISTKSTKGDKKMFNGQRGIISCISMSPSIPGLYACGSYNKTIAIYADELKNPQFVLQGQMGGVTHLMYSPDGNCIFSGGRKDDEILCWDMRQLGSVLCVFGRKVDTNQRIYFDIDKNGKCLMTGNTDGTIKIWDLKCPSENVQFQAHTDCANSVSFNPFLPLIASGCGQRKLDEYLTRFIEGEDDSATLSNCDDVEETCIKIWHAGSLH